MKKYPRMYTVIVTCLMLLGGALYSSPARAQEPSPLDPTRLVFEKVTGDYGNIYDVIQDKDGFLWLAGANGAIKYNGYEAETVVNTQGSVSALFEDSEGLIWMIVGTGVTIYDKKTGKTIQYTANPDDPNALSGTSFIAFQKSQLMTEDKDGFIWIATMNGLNKFDKKSGKFTAYKSQAGDPQTLLDNDVWSVLTAKDGSLWVGTATGLHKFDPQTGQVLEHYAVNDNDPNALHGERVQAIVEDNEGLIWAGTIEGGLNRLDPQSKTFTHYRADSPESQKIAHDSIYRLANFESAPDLIWITTLDGLSILDKRANTVTNYVYDAAKVEQGGLGGKIVHTIIQDKSGIFWLVVNEHGFLQKIDGGARQFQSILTSKDPTQGFSDVPCPVRLGPDGNIWVTEVRTGIAQVDPKTGRIINHFLPDPQKPEGFPAQIEDFDFDPHQKDIIWVVVTGEVVEYNWRTETVVNKYPSGTQTKVWPVWTDKRNPDFLYGTVWGEGLFKFDKQTGQAKIIAPDPANPEETISGPTSLPVMPAYYQMEGNQIWLIAGAGYDVFDLDTEKVVKKYLFNKTDFTSEDFRASAGYIDAQRRFWVGHNQYDPASEKFTSFKDLYDYSYPTTAPRSLTGDKQGLLWNGGAFDGTLTRFNPETGETKVFTQRDGVSPGLACVAAPVALADGQIWMAGTGGVTYFYPDKIVDNSYQAPVHITQLTQGGEPMPLGVAPERTEEITLNWDKNFFEFGTAALSYRRPEENQYQYKLEGVDTDWYNSGTRRFGRYAGLNEGMYMLKVKGSNNDGVWSDDIATLKVSVAPHILEGTRVFKLADIQGGQPVNLSYDDNNLLFEAAPLDYSILEKKNYTYKLEGYDSDWTSIASSRYIPYKNVGEGSYTFRVKNTETNEEYASSITIQPPFYRSWWFLSLVGVTALGVVVGAYAIRMGQVKAAQALRESRLEAAAAQAQAKAVQAQAETEKAQVKADRAQAEAEKAKLEAEGARMKAELDINHRLQQMLLPSQAELNQIEDLDIAGFMQPADEVGGDYYDVLRYGDRVKIGIGDVTGHGLESGMVMLMAQTAVRTLLASGVNDPACFLDLVNRTLRANLQRMGVEKSMSLALLDYQGGQFRVGVSGQHEQVLVVRQNGQVEIKDTIDLGFPVGLVEEIAQFVSESNITLEPGDGLVLFSDGFTEAENDAGEFYGLERLCQAVSAHWSQPAEAIKEAVVADVRQFIGSHTVYDDLALLVIKQK